MMQQNRIETIEQRLRDALSPAELEIINESHKHVGHEGAKTGMGHFAVKISSARFAGKSKIECHRMIYDALGDMMQTDIHALRIEIVAN